MIGDEIRYLGAVQAFDVVAQLIPKDGLGQVAKMARPVIHTAIQQLFGHHMGKRKIPFT